MWNWVEAVKAGQQVYIFYILYALKKEFSNNLLTQLYDVKTLVVSAWASNPINQVQ